MLPIIELVLGSALLFAGRKLYWLLAATMGFVAGLYLADLLLPNEPETTGLIIAFALAFGGALLLVVFQRALIGLVGFLAGGVALNLLLGGMTSNLLTETWMAAAVFIVGGAVGAFLLYKLFNLGLIILSAIIGAYVVMTGFGGLFPLSPTLFSVALILLIAIGILIQLGLFRR